MKNTDRIIGLLSILILGLSIFVSNHLIFIFISLITMFLGVSQNISDRKEIKHATYYFRENTSFLMSLKEIGVIILLFLIFLNPPLNTLFDNTTSYYTFFGYIGLMVASYYQNFINSLRFFENGLKMPGRNSQMIPWADISQIRFNENIVELIVNNVSTKIHIDNRDIEELKLEVERWEFNNDKKR